METALVTRLTGDTTIAAMLAAAGTAVSWHGFQRGDGYPAIALMMVTPGEEWTHAGPDPIARPRVRFDLRARNADTLATLVAAVKARMRLQQDVSTTRFHPAVMEADRTFDREEDAGGAVLFQRQLEFMFYHEEIS